MQQEAKEVPIVFEPLNEVEIKSILGYSHDTESPTNILQALNVDQATLTCYQDHDVIEVVR